MLSRQCLGQRHRDERQAFAQSGDSPAHPGSRGTLGCTQPGSGAHSSANVHVVVIPGKKNSPCFRESAFPVDFRHTFSIHRLPGRHLRSFAVEYSAGPESLAARRHSSGQVPAFRHSVCLRGNGSLTVGDSPEGVCCQNDSFGTWNLVGRGYGTPGSHKATSNAGQEVLAPLHLFLLGSGGRRPGAGAPGH